MEMVSEARRVTVSEARRVTVSETMGAVFAFASVAFFCEKKRTREKKGERERAKPIGGNEEADAMPGSGEGEEEGTGSRQRIKRRKWVRFFQKEIRGEDGEECRKRVGTVYGKYGERRLGGKILECNGYIGDVA
uniref:Uncharacterized protein n=1 Tax=Ananas comosus var. bracteatus TaxID=296719 RepID=A0A6V7NJI4_ANACO|nr:unnamed protein product [Ananas comosus var. bracteatus]